MKKFVVSSLFFLFLSGLAVANNMKGKVVAVLDGNTLQVLANDGKTYNLMLAGIDCPELKQAYGEDAKICLEKLALGKQVTVKVTGKDKLGNALAEILIDGKKDPRIQLLKDGLAWTTEKNPDSELEAHRVASQMKKKGLWKDENPTPPWVYRREQSMTEAKSM
ncbi:MAG TPA: thermonuclease family protein [Chryseolinea sp.]|nr:thermonuclease family protein [Chryseolinea sp.]